MRTRRLHRGALAAGITAVLLAGTMAYALAEPSTPPSAPEDSVAVQPDVQGWFQAHEAERIAVNDALQQTNAAIAAGATGDPTAACTALQQASDAMLAALPTPKQSLDAQVVAGIEQFRTGARQCLAGDLAGARQTIAAGVEARGIAENEIEELLESPDGSVD